MASGKKNYFRHSFSSHNDPKLVQIVEKFGMSGYAYFWIILELCGEQSTESETRNFVVHQRVLLSNLMVRKDKLRSYLAATTQLRLIHAVFDGTIVKLEIPNFPKYLGRYEIKKALKTPNKIKENKIKTNNQKGDDVDFLIFNLTEQETSELMQKYSLSRDALESYAAMVPDNVRNPVSYLVSLINKGVEPKKPFAKEHEFEKIWEYIQGNYPSASEFGLTGKSLQFFQSHYKIDLASRTKDEVKVIYLKFLSGN